MAEAAKRQLVICSECEGTGEKKVTPFTMIGQTKYVECDKCKGDGQIRLPLPPTVKP